MFIIYDINIHNVLSFAGIRGEITDLELDRLEIPELPVGKGAFKLRDKIKINEVWQAIDAGGTVELVFDDETPIDIQIIDLPEIE